MGQAMVGAGRLAVVERAVGGLSSQHLAPRLGTRFPALRTQRMDQARSSKQQQDAAERARAASPTGSPPNDEGSCSRRRCGRR